MADKYYSVIKGESLPYQVTEGSSTSSEAIELRVSDTVYANKLDVILALNAIVEFMKSVETSPVA